MSTHNICFCREIRKICRHPLLTGAMFNIMSLKSCQNMICNTRKYTGEHVLQMNTTVISQSIGTSHLLSLPLIQEGQLSVSGKRMCTILFNRLED